VRVSSLIEFLDAAADTKYVTGPFEERGGVMLVGPPGTFKTTIIEAAMENHPDCIICSDLNVHQWLKMKPDFVSNRYSTLAFAEFEKVYQRHPATAANLEGIIKALVSEGFGTGPGGDLRMPRIKARALLIGGITTDYFERQYDNWQRNGFLRRLLWLVVSLENADAIVEAIRKWERIDFGKISYRPANRQIKVDVSVERSKLIEKLMREQPGLHGTGYVLMKKILSVMEWKYGGSNGAGNKAMEILNEIAPALSNDGGLIELGRV